MTMKESRETVAAGDFKARCLKLLDRVAMTGQPIVVTKRGKAVAMVVPARDRAAGSLLGSVQVHGDIVGPILDDWAADE